MKKNFVARGEYYFSEKNGRARTVCRGIDMKTGESMIAFVKVNEGGVASEVFFISEAEFRSMYLD